MPPQDCKSKPKKSSPKIARGLLVSRNTNDDLRTQYAKLKTPEAKLLYTTYNTVYKMVLKASKVSTFGNAFECNKGNPREFWRIVKQELGIETAQDGLPESFIK